MSKNVKKRGICLKNLNNLKLPKKRDMIEKGGVHFDTL